MKQIWLIFALIFAFQVNLVAKKAAEEKYLVIFSDFNPKEFLIICNRFTKLTNIKTRIIFAKPNAMQSFFNDENNMRGALADLVVSKNAHCLKKFEKNFRKLPENFIEKNKNLCFLGGKAFTISGRCAFLWSKNKKFRKKSLIEIINKIDSAKIGINCQPEVFDALLCQIIKKQGESAAKAFLAKLILQNPAINQRTRKVDFKILDQQAIIKNLATNDLSNDMEGVTIQPLSAAGEESQIQISSLALFKFSKNHLAAEKFAFFLQDKAQLKHIFEENPIEIPLKIIKIEQFFKSFKINKNISQITEISPEIREIISQSLLKKIYQNE